MRFKTILAVVFFLCCSSRVWAVNWGVHVLSPDELAQVLPIRDGAETFYVTVPYSIYDRRAETWNTFFEECEKNRITPLVRLVTKFEDGKWIRPTRYEITEAVKFFRGLKWQEPRYIILFNEPNHAIEWGGKVDADDYAVKALFTANWLRTEKQKYFVLPAGLDAAAPNGRDTAESLGFMQAVLRKTPDFLESIDGWTSHSYPNPGFVGSVYDTSKQSIRGFEAELKLLARWGKGDLPVYITETGWKVNRSTASKMDKYYKYAADKVWNNPQVKAVTVFLLQGSEGPFEEFSLLNQEGKPTVQLEALKKVMNLSN